MIKLFLTGLSLCIATSGLSSPWAGKTLRVLSFRDTHSEAVQKRIYEFEKMTGAKVVFDAIASNAVAAKTITDQLGGGSYDLYTVDEPFMPQMANFFLAHDSWPQPKLTPAKDVQLNKYLKVARDGGSFKGTLYGLPVNGNVYMYVYRKDLFENAKEKEAFQKQFGYSLAPPETLQQMEDVAKFFTRPPNLYGFAPFTRKSEGTTVEAMWALGSHGVEIFDDQVQLVLNTEKAAAAFAWYKKMMQYSPKGSKSWHHSERMSAYSKGQMAQIMTWPSFVKGLENPEKSLVVGKSSYKAPPAAKDGKPAAIAGTWTLAISKSSKNPSLAAEFAYWWGSSRFGKELVKNGMNPARIDLLKDPDLVKSNSWFPGILVNFENAIVRPRFPQYKRVSDVISKWFTRMVAEQSTPKEAAQGLKDELKKLQERIAKSNKRQKG